MPGRSIGTMKYEMPVYLLVSGSVRAMRMPNFATCARDVQIFWPLTTNTSPSRHRACRQAGEVGAGVGLGEELAPHLLAPEHRREVALLLLVVAVARRCTGPQWPMPIGFIGFVTPARLISSSMISCSSGSASRPQGVGQCGTT